MPFLITRRAFESVRAVDALASNSCGSVLGFESRLVTVTRLPPMACAMDPYWFSAATTATVPLACGEDAAARPAATTPNVTAVSSPSARRDRATAERRTREGLIGISP